MTQGHMFPRTSKQASLGFSLSMMCGASAAWQLVLLEASVTALGGTTANISLGSLLLLGKPHPQPNLEKIVAQGSQT